MPDETPNAPQGTPSAAPTPEAPAAPQGFATDPAAAPAAPQKPGFAADPVAPEQVSPETPKAPDKYELKLPDGSRLDPAYVERIETYARSKGLSNEQAQQILEQSHGAVSEYEAAQVQGLKKISSDWFKEIQSDPVVGGHAFAESSQIAHETALKWFGKDFVDAFTKLGFNNHPALFRGLVAIGRASKAPNFVNPGAPPPSRKSTEEVLFPSMFQKSA